MAPRLLGRRTTLALVAIPLALLVGWAWFGRGIDDAAAVSHVVLEAPPAPGERTAAMGAQEVEAEATRALVPEAASPAVDVDVAATDPHDLVVRVVGPDGKPRNGVPLYLEPEVPDEELRLYGDLMRTSGIWGDRVKFDVDDFGSNVFDERFGGMARWSGSYKILGNLWETFERGEQTPALKLVVGLPGAEHLGLPLSFSAWPTEPVELRLDAAMAPAVELLPVEVYFADGRPAPDIPVFVGIAALNPEFGRATGLDSYSVDPDKAPRTDAEGRVALLRHFVVQLNAMGVLAGRGPMVEPFVAPALPLAEQLRVQVPEDLAVGQAVRVDLPELGSLRGLLVDHLGRPLEFVGDEPAFEYRVRWRSPRGRRGDLEGSASTNPFEIGLCGLGVDLDGRAWVLDWSFPQGRIELPGPERAGESVLLRFELGEPYPNVRFSVLGLDGAPLADAEVGTLVRRLQPTEQRDFRSRRTWFSRRTDSAGGFSMTWRSRGPVLPSVFELEAEVDGEPAWARLVLPVEFEQVFTPAGERVGDAAVMDGGVLRLMRTPLPALPVWTVPILASGTVVDEAGLPLEGVWVGGAALEDSTNLRGVRTDSTGSFEIGDDHRGPFYLRVSLAGYEGPVTDDFESGARDLTFVMKKMPDPGRLYGSLLNIPETSGDSLEVRVAQGGYGESPGRDGAFEFRKLPPGEVTVYITCKALELEFIEFPGVKVESNQRLTDPRFEALDVAPLVRLHHFTFETATGEAFDSTRVHLQFEDGTQARLRIGSRAERDVFVPAKFTSATVLARGFAPLEISLTEPDVRLRFQRL